MCPQVQGQEKVTLDMVDIRPQVQGLEGEVTLVSLDVQPQMQGP